MSKLNIIMCTFNGEQYIEEQIESILNNTYSQWKLIICDDGSTDNTVNLIKKYESQYPDKIILRQNKTNMGVIYNFLTPILEYEADYYMFCDQDDVWLTDKIEHTLHLMKRKEKKYGYAVPITVFSDAKVVNEKLEVRNSSFHKVSKLNIKKLDLPHMLMENKLIGCTMMFNAAVVKKIESLPSAARMHDWWIAIISASFGKIAYLNEATLLYRQHEKNVVGNQSFLSYVSNRVSSLKKQKIVLLNTIKQAENFYELYKDDLLEIEKDIFEKFISLQDETVLKKRYLLIKYGFLKSGWIRNIGLLFII